MSKLPNLLVVGPPKTATTWLFKCLHEHPLLYIPKQKQLHFYDRNFDKGLDWYKSQFKTDGNQYKLVADITPDYLSLKEAPSRIFDSLGLQVLIVVIYRDPSRRAYSEYLMKLRTGKVTGTFDEAVKQDPLIVENSLYFKNISRFREWYPDSNIIVLSYEKLVNNSRIFLAEFYEKLQLDFHLPSVLHEKINEGGRVSRFRFLLKLGIKVRKRIELSGMGRDVIGYMRDAGILGYWHKLVLKKKAKSTVDEPDYNSIEIQYFKQDIVNVSRIKHLFIT